MNYTGAESATGWKWDRAITVLMKKGEHIESFRKRVRMLIASNAGEAAGKPEEGDAKLNQWLKDSPEDAELIGIGRVNHNAHQPTTFWYCQFFPHYLGGVTL